MSGEDPFDKSVNKTRNQKSKLAGKPETGHSTGDDDPFDKGTNTSRNQKSK